VTAATRKATAAGMAFESLVRSRYSCRRFLPVRVPGEDIDRILELAQRAPSWCNCQPWEVLLLAGDALERFRERLYAHAASGVPPAPDFPFPRRYEGIYRERRKVCGVQLYQALGIGRDDRAAAREQSLENFRLFGAPHLALITTEQDLGVYGAVDCGLYVAHFLLAATSVGVDAIAQAALASYPDLVRDEFALPASRMLVCGIAFGYADAGHAIHAYRTERAALPQVVRRFE
jgi:nitroreductase